MNSTNEYRNMKNHFCLNLFFLLYLFFCAGCKQHISDSAAKANEALFTQLDSLIDNSDKLNFAERGANRGVEAFTKTI